MPEPLKPIKAEVWIVDIETVPCVSTGRKIYNLGGAEDHDVRDHMFEKAGASFENPHPMLKTLMHEVVCISILRRQITADGVMLSLRSLRASADEEIESERDILATFFDWIGKRKPQIVGYNTTGFDLTVLYQRAIIHGLDISKFCERPEKPWEAMPDYFSAANAWNVDLGKTVGGWGKETPSLVEICRACGIPAKEGGNGSDVLANYLKGDIDSIVRYCESDVLATYLLWLRLAETCWYISGEEADAEIQEALKLFNPQAEGATA